MTKVSFFDRRVIENFLKVTAFISTALSLIVIFVEIPKECKDVYGWAFLISLLLIYIGIWVWSNKLTKINVTIEGSDVTIKVGDIFQEPDFKVIAFNEYFDTQVDNKIISEGSLNGVFIKEHLHIPVADLDEHIATYDFDKMKFWAPMRIESKERNFGTKLVLFVFTAIIF